MPALQHTARAALPARDSGGQGAPARAPRRQPLSPQLRASWKMMRFMVRTRNTELHSEQYTQDAHQAQLPARAQEGHSGAFRPAGRCCGRPGLRLGAASSCPVHCTGRSTQGSACPIPVTRGWLRQAGPAPWADTKQYPPRPLPLPFRPFKPCGWQAHQHGSHSSTPTTAARHAACSPPTSNHGRHEDHAGRHKGVAHVRAQLRPRDHGGQPHGAQQHVGQQRVRQPGERGAPHLRRGGRQRVGCAAALGQGPRATAQGLEAAGPGP